MNKGRRKKLYSIVHRLQTLNDMDMNVIESMINELENILREEEYYMDNIPENMQCGYKYQVAEDACDNLESAISALADRDIDDAINYIYDATV